MLVGLRKMDEDIGDDMDELDDEKCPVCGGVLVDGKPHDHIDDSPSSLELTVGKPRGDY